MSVLIAIPFLAIGQDAREIVRRSVELDRKNTELARSYTFLQRQETRELDGSGQLKKNEIRTYDVTLLEESPYRRLVARNDQPLSPAERQQEEEKLQKSIELRRKETPEQKERRVAEWRHKQEKQREPLQELPDAFNFTVAGEETLDGVATYVIDANPKSDFKPKSSSSSFFPKIKARFWISKQEYQWARLDMETLDTIAFGGVLFRLGKGSHLMMENTRVNSEVWLPKRISLQAMARVLLLKGYHADLLYTFSDYKKFQTDSRVIPGAQPQF